MRYGWSSEGEEVELRTNTRHLLVIFYFVFDTCASVFSPLLAIDTYSARQYPTGFAFMAINDEGASLTRFLTALIDEEELIIKPFHSGRMSDGRRNSIDPFS